VRALSASALRALRRLGAHPRLLPLTALLLRARAVRPATAFFLREALGREEVRRYRLRENGLLVELRHGTGDVVTLGEVFHDHQYTPTGEIEAALGEVSSVLDLGANIGLFGAFAAARWPRAEIVAFEPDPANAELHECTIAANGLQDRWRLVRAAAAAAPGRAEFVSGGVALSHLADITERGPGESQPASGEDPPGAPGLLPGAVKIDVELRDVVTQLAETDLLKMDIEGGEWAILGDARFRERPPRAVVLEYHPRFCPGDDPAAAAEAALAQAGLRVQSIWRGADGHGMLWAWRG
jgi:FkbM family methyltransferase